MPYRELLNRTMTKLRYKDATYSVVFTQPKLKLKAYDGATQFVKIMTFGKSEVQTQISFLAC